MCEYFKVGDCVNKRSIKEEVKSIIKDGVERLAGGPAVKSAGVTDRGMKRANNEDNFYADDKRGVFIVSDGMGGAQAGEKASEMVVHRLPVQMRAARRSSQPEFAIEKAIEDLSDEIRDYMNQREDLKGAGATVVACLVRRGKAFIGHIGDSRAYLVRDNLFQQLTQDHSIVACLIKSGLITEEEAKNHPAKNQITRCMGMKDRPRADVQTLELIKGDVLLLCTDGLTGMISDEEIEKILADEKDIQSACNKLIDSANSAGGKDNITAVIIQYGLEKETSKNPVFKWVKKALKIENEEEKEEER